MKNKLPILCALAVLLLLVGWTAQTKPSPFVVGRTYGGIGDKALTFTVLEDRGAGWLKVRGRVPVIDKEMEYLVNTSQLHMLLEK